MITHQAFNIWWCTHIQICTGMTKTAFIFRNEKYFLGVNSICWKMKGWRGKPGTPGYLWGMLLSPDIGGQSAVVLAATAPFLLLSTLSYKTDKPLQLRLPRCTIANLTTIMEPSLRSSVSANIKSPPVVFWTILLLLTLTETFQFAPAYLPSTHASALWNISASRQLTGDDDGEIFWVLISTILSTFLSQGPMGRLEVRLQGRCWKERWRQQRQRQWQRKQRQSQNWRSESIGRKHWWTQLDSE